MKRMYFLLPGLITSFMMLLQFQASATNYIVSVNTGTGAGSLPDAIAQCNANSASAPHTITFAAGMDGLTIANYTGTLTCPNVTIDGTTMPGYSCGNPRVMISSSAFNSWAFTGNGCVLKGVRVFGGIQLNGPNQKVLSCVFNIDFAGAIMATAAKASIRFNNAAAASCIVGGLSNCERNIMGGAGAFCVIFDATGNNNQILGNYMGTDVTGLNALGAGFTTVAVRIDGGTGHIFDGNVIGNVQSGSQGMAMFINGGSSFTIQNNNIGANANRLFIPGLAFGTAATGHNGVYFNNAGDNSTVTNNVIGNTKFVTNAGINGNVITVESTDNITLQNNYIGCDIAFNNGGSSWAGVYYYSGCVGGTITGNYIGYNGITSAQRSHGIAIFANTGTMTISNNYIGVTPSGTDMGNGDAGIELNTQGAGAVFNITGNYIGFNKCMRTTAPGSLTSESGGIRIISARTVNISNNYIGTLPGGRQNCGNSWLGIGIEGSTTTSISITNNVIAYNARNAIQTYGNGSDKVLISQNCIFCNNNEGIELSAGSVGSPGGGTGNASFGRSFATGDGAKTTVQLSTGFAAWQCDFSGATWILRGYAPAGSTVEIFQIHHCGCDNTNQTTTVTKVNGTQGLDYISSVTADANGRWTYSLPAGNVKNGFTVTASDLANNRTSEFSPCVSVTTTCLPPVTVTNGSASLTPVCGNNFTVTGSPTLIRTSCYNNIYYTWLKNGVVVYGPSLTYVDYTVNNSADPADDGTYVLQVEDGNGNLATCYQQGSTSVDVSCPMEINLISFTGEPMHDGNKIMWQMLSDESGTVEIERSLDGRNFSFLDSRAVYLGTTNDYIMDYTNDSRVYYRLNIKPSIDHQYYSKIIVVDKNIGLDITLVQGNAGSLNVQVNTSNEQDIYFVLYDMRGIALHEGEFHVTAGKNEHRLDLSKLPTGAYIMKTEGSVYGPAENMLFVHQP